MHLAVRARDTFRTEPASIPLMKDWLTEQLTEGEVDEGVVFRVLLCAEEWVTNLWMHARWSETNPPEETSKVPPVRHVQCLLTQAEIIGLSLRDVSEPFDPTTPTRHRENADEMTRGLGTPDIEHAPVGGLGLKLIADFCDGMAYARKDGCNQLDLTFNRWRE